MNDTILQHWAGRIRAAAADKQPLRLRGGGSKDFYGQALAGEVFDTREYRGVVAFEPTELVVTARCGTPLAELEALLAEKGQFLAFEPPHFSGVGAMDPSSPPAPLLEGEGRLVTAAPETGMDPSSPLAPLLEGEGRGGATVGGMVAAGLSGPRRQQAGGVRDFVLGVKIIDGRGELLNFGGRVMKNVAGYDVPRLMAGSLGTLGVIAEVSLKVLPFPPAEQTLSFELPQDQALARLNEWGGQPLPIGASAWAAGVLRLRLSGARAAVAAAAAKLGGETLGAAEADAYWRSLREQTHPVFAGAAPLWRLSVATLAPPLPGAALIEWGGAQRWLRGECDPLGALDAKRLREMAAAQGGHASLFRGEPALKNAAGAFQPLPPVLARIHRELKQAFDPAGVFNPGRLYPDF